MVFTCTHTIITIHNYILKWLPGKIINVLQPIFTSHKIYYLKPNKNGNTKPGFVSNRTIWLVSWVSLSFPLPLHKFLYNCTQLKVYSGTSKAQEGDDEKEKETIMGEDRDRYKETV